MRPNDDPKQVPTSWRDPAGLSTADSLNLQSLAHDTFEQSMNRPKEVYENISTREKAPRHTRWPVAAGTRKLALGRSKKNTLVCVEIDPQTKKGTVMGWLWADDAQHFIDFKTTVGAWLISPPLQPMGSYPYP